MAQVSEAQPPEVASGAALGASSDAAPVPAHAPRRRVIIRPSRGWATLGLRELWEYRELLYLLGWRDIRVRYKQSALGMAWAVAQPLALMGVFSLFLGQFLKVSSQGFPYPVFVFTALLPWTMFAQSLGGAAMSLVASSHLVAKVYFPRLALPIAATAPFVLDFVVGMGALVLMMLLYGISPSAAILAFPLFAVLALLTALAVGIWLSALNTRYRDVQAAVPLLVQVWLFASPVAYPSTLVPERWRVVYGLNPMVGVIDGFRWALLGSKAPELGVIFASLGGVLALLLGSLAYFKRTERTFADVI